MRCVLYCILPFLIVLLACKNAQPDSSKSAINHDDQASEAHLGLASMEVSGDPDAVKFFDEGLLMLHSFEYKDAAAQFRKAQEVDPEMAMAYWGEAMTKNHPLWSANYLEEGQEILERLAPSSEERLAKAKSELERDFMAAVEILFGDGEKLDQDKAYAQHMELLYEKYPDNNEVAAFYALSLLGSVSERNDQVYGKSAKVAQAILASNARHPGALHYLIHSYDDPDHAHLALDAANKYSKVAPDAGHALHMPSHIYIALGMWDEVISSNIASWEASRKRKELKELDNDALNYHALHWLMYGYLQRGEEENARGLMEKMENYAEELSSERGRAYSVGLRSTYFAETGNWDHPLASASSDVDDLNIIIRSQADFMRGMVAYAEEDAATLGDVIIEMQAQREEAHKKMMQRGGQMCSGVGWTSQLPTQSDLNNAQVMEMELQALRSLLAGSVHQAEMWFNKATALEEETSFMFGPPTVVKPAHELYGEWLLEHNFPEMAVKQFDLALQRCPGKRLSVDGKSRAEAKLNSNQM